MKNTFIQDEQFEMFPDETEDELRTGKLTRGYNSGKITERELIIIKMRFGVDMPNEESWTLHQIATLYGVTRERIRQLEERGMKKLRKNPEMQKLKILVCGD